MDQELAYRSRLRVSSAYPGPRVHPGRGMGCTRDPGYIQVPFQRPEGRYRSFPGSSPAKNKPGRPIYGPRRALGDPGRPTEGPGKPTEGPWGPPGALRTPWTFCRALFIGLVLVGNDLPSLSDTFIFFVVSPMQLMRVFCTAKKQFLSYGYLWLLMATYIYLFFIENSIIYKFDKYIL